MRSEHSEMSDRASDVAFRWGVAAVILVARKKSWVPAGARQSSAAVTQQDDER